MKVKEKTLAKRCEICHQNDCFDAEKEYCSRCNALKLLKVEKRQTNEIQIKQPQGNKRPTIAATLVGNILGTILILIYMPNIASSHWWKDDNWPIILWVFSVLLGQILLPFVVLQKVDKQMVIRVFSWSVAGLIGAIVFPFLYGVSQIFFREGTFDAFDVCLNKYFRIDLLWIVMLALGLSPFLGIFLSSAIDRVSKHFNTNSKL